MPVARNVLVQLHVHDAIFAERVHGARLGFARLKEAERLGDRHLIDEDLAFSQRRLGDPVTRLDDRGLACIGRRLDAGSLHEECANRDRVGRVVGALVDDLEHVVRSKDRGRHLDAAGTPAVRHRHLARGERDLITRNRDRLQDRAADHPLRLLVEIGEVVAARSHSAASATAP